MGEAGLRETHAEVPDRAAPVVAAPGRLVVQRKSVVGAVDDPTEAEADRIAELVVRSLGNPTAGVPASVARVRRATRVSPVAAPAATTPESADRIRRAPVIGAAGGTVDADTERRIRTAAGGTRLDPGVRDTMEGAFGADFSGVRVHTGPESEQLNDRIQASAFTAGNHVWFRDGMPDTSSPTGQHLLAHELTHVVQQGAGSVRRRPATIRREPLTIRRKDDTIADLGSLKSQQSDLEKRKAQLEQQIVNQEAKVAKAGLLAKIAAKSDLNKLKKQRDKVTQQLNGLTGRIDPLQKLKDADDKRRAEEARIAEQSRIDKATKSYAQLSKLRLGALAEYLASTPDWDKNSKVSSAERDLVNAVNAFGSAPENQAPCAAFTLADMTAAVPTAGGTMAELIDRLNYYVAAAGERRDPFPVTTQRRVDNAAEIGEGLSRLLGAFPRWVLAGAMREGQLFELIDNGFVDDLIKYYKFSAKPPVFQARGGADFVAYLRMRLDDGVDPTTFQAGPLSAYIRNFHRFQAAALKGLAANLADTSKSRPLTLILHSAIDHNGAFHRDPNMTAVITHKANLTLMIEGGETLAEYQNQIGPLAKSHGNNDKIDQVMFAGHGGSRVIEMAGTIQENTHKVEQRGSIAQDEEPIDLDDDLAGAQAFFDEILDNMDKAIVDKLAPPGPAQQQNRRILFNACLTNSNEVGRALTHDRKTARKEIREYIENNASLATYMAKYATKKGADVTSLGANASITQVELIDTSTGQLDLVAPQDPKVTASKLVYLEHGTEPHGALLAALEAWAYDPIKAKEAMRRRAKKKSTEWDHAVIEGAFDLALRFQNDDSFASDLQTLAGHAHVLSELRLKEECRVSKLNPVLTYWKADANWQSALLGRLVGSALFKQFGHTALVMVQADAVTRSIPQARALIVDQILPNFDTKTARDFVDVPFLETGGVMATLMGQPATPGTITLALLGVLDPAKPTSCVEHLRKLSSPGAAALPKLPAVDPVPEVPEGVGPRDKVPAEPEVKGRPKVAEIPGKRPESPEVPDLPALPELAAVAGPSAPTKKRGKPGAAPKAPGRAARPGRPEAPAIPEVKPFFDPKHDIERLLAGRATEAAIALAVQP